VFGAWTYLIFELGWSMPVLVLHWLVGRRVLIRHFRILVLGAVVPTLYLSAADSVAIANGIWVLHGNRLVGLHIGNVPIEESIFFLVTNLMVVQSILLVASFRRPR
jgi:lycopene cyclase domain-containing protein